MITKPSLSELVTGLIRNFELALDEEGAGRLAPTALSALGVLDRLAVEIQSHQALLAEENRDIRDSLKAIDIALPADCEADTESTDGLDAAQLTISRLEAENRALKAAIEKAVAELDLPAAAGSDKNGAIDEKIRSLLLRILHREDRVAARPPRVPPTSGDPNLKGAPAEVIEKALREFFQHELRGAENIELINLKPLSGGASREVWFFDIRWREDNADRFEECIFMREPIGSVLVSDKAPGQMTGTRRTTADEIKAIKAMDAAGVPVASVLWSDTSGEWMERPFFISQRLKGTADVAPLIGSEDGPKVLSEYVQILAKIHTLDPASLDLPSFGDVTPKNAALAQVELFERNYREQRRETYPAIDYMIGWLKKNQPKCERLSVIHGDYRLGNFMHADGAITGILDWEQVHLGDPAEEIAFMYWALWSLGAVIAIDDFVDMYQAASGLTVSREALAYYRVFIELKMFVVGLTGIAAFYAKPEFQIHYGSATNSKLIRDAQLRALEEIHHGGPSVAFDAFQAKDFAAS